MHGQVRFPAWKAVQQAAVAAFADAALRAALVVLALADGVRVIDHPLAASAPAGVAVPHAAQPQAL